MAASRIVITGLGTFSPLAPNAPDTWSALLDGASGARSLEQPWVTELALPVTFASQAAVDPETVLDRVEAKRLDRGSQFSLLAAREAWKDAGEPEVEPERLGAGWGARGGGGGAPPEA